MIAFFPIACMSRQSELTHFNWNTNRQTNNFFSLFYLNLQSTLVGTGLWGHGSSTLWPPTGPGGAFQVHWLAGKVEGDCSKLAVGRLLMLSRDAGVQLPHLASLSGLSQRPPAPVSLLASLSFELRLKDKSGDISKFFLLLTNSTKKTETNNDLILLMCIACVTKAWCFLFLCTTKRHWCWQNDLKTHQWATGLHASSLQWTWAL